MYRNREIVRTNRRLFEILNSDYLGPKIVDIKVGRSVDNFFAF